MSLFRPRQPRPFQHEYRYARPKRLISDSLTAKEPSHRVKPLMSILLILILLLLILVLYLAA